MDETTARFFSYIERMSKNSKMYEDTEITPENVYQIAHKANRDLLYESVKIIWKEVRF